MRYVKAAREAGLPVAVVSSSSNARDVLRAAGHRGPVRHRHRRHGRRARAPARQARARHVPGRRPCARRRARARRGLRGRARRRRGRPRRRFRTRRRRRPRRPGRRSCASTAPTSWSRTWPSCWSDERPSPLRRAAPVADPRGRARPGPARPARIGVRPGERAHRPARHASTRASRTACPGTYLNGVYESRPLPYAEAGYGFPEARPDGGQRHERQADPPAGRRRAVRRPLRRAALAPPRARHARRARSSATSSGARPPGRRCACARVRLVSLVHRAVAAIHWEVEPIGESARTGRAVRARGQRGAARARLRGPARRRRAARAAGACSRPGQGHGSRWCTARAPASCWSARPWTT